MEKQINAIQARLKQCRKRVDEAIEENYGYCPQDTVFDKMMEELRDLESQCQIIDPGYYSIYKDKHY